jgi:hypothetical protein
MVLLKKYKNLYGNHLCYWMMYTFCFEKCGVLLPVLMG